MKHPPVTALFGLLVVAAALLPNTTHAQPADRPDPADALPPGATRRIGSDRFRGPSVETIAFSPDGRQVAGRGWQRRQGRRLGHADVGGVRQLRAEDRLVPRLLPRPGQPDARLLLPPRLPAARPADRQAVGDYPAQAVRFQLARRL